MNWLQILANGGQQQPAQMNDPYSAQLALDNAQQDRQRAMQMQQAQYQGGGASGILAALLQNMGGKQLERKADESASAAVARQFEFQNKAAQQAAEKAAADEERKFQRDLERDRKKAEAAAANRAKTTLDYLPEADRGRAARISSGLELGAQAPQRVSYGAPVEVMGPDGKPMLVRPGSDGSMSPVNGFGPRPQTGNVPAGYQPGEGGALAPIPGGPADPAVKDRALHERTAIKFREKLAPLKDAEAAFGRMGALVQKYGTEQMPGAAKSQLLTAYTNARDSIRVLAATGVLNVGELPFLEQKLNDPTAWTSMSAPNIMAQLDEINQFLATKKNTLAETYGAAPAAPAPAAAQGGWAIQRVD